MCLFLGIHNIYSEYSEYIFSVIQFCVSVIPAICGGSGTCMIICYNLFTMSVSVCVEETCGGGT